MATDFIKVRVTTYDTELEYTVKRKTTGQALFDQVVQTIGVRETWYFGLRHKTKTDKVAWLDLVKKIAKQDVKKDGNFMRFDFRVKFYPEDIDEILQVKTLKLFFQQVKNDILSENLFATADKCVLLASYAAQSKHGDYDEEEHAEGYLSKDKLLPKEVVDKHTLTSDEWEAKVSTFHKNHSGVTKEEAMMEYLKLAQDLEMFGITYYPVTNKQGSEVDMGIDSRGINIYKKGDKLNPNVSFPWSEVTTVKPSKKDLKIKLQAPNNQKTPPFIIKTLDAAIIMDMATGNQKLFVMRRKQDSLEMQQMKRERDDRRAHEAATNAKLKREMTERHKSQAAAKDFEEKFMAMQAQMREHQEELAKAQQRIAELEQQLKESSEAKEALIAQQDELKEMMASLEKDNEMELTQKQELLDEIEKKRAEIEESRALVDAKEEETKKLREEMEAANEQVKEANAKMNETLAAAMGPPASSVAPMKPPRLEVLEEGVQQNGGDHLQEDDADEVGNFEKGNLAVESRRSSVASTLHNGGDELPEGIEMSPEDLEGLEVRDREPSNYQQHQDDIINQLQAELEAARDATVPEGNLERIAAENKKEGRDKFKTLREIRSGFAKRRIDTFENM